MRELYENRCRAAAMARRSGLPKSKTAKNLYGAYVTMTPPAGVNGVGEWRGETAEQEKLV